MRRCRHRSRPGSAFPRIGFSAGARHSRSLFPWPRLVRCRMWCMMTLSPMMAVLVLAAALMHASWNVMAKTTGDKLLNIGLISLGLGVVGLVFIPFVSFPDAASWHFLLGSLLAHLGYYVFLSSGYRHGDLSQVYPIAR